MSERKSCAGLHNEEGLLLRIAELEKQNLRLSGMHKPSSLAVRISELERVLDCYDGTDASDWWMEERKECLKSLNTKR